MKKFLLGSVALILICVGGLLLISGMTLLVPVYWTFIVSTLAGHLVFFGGALVTAIGGGLWAVRK